MSILCIPKETKPGEGRVALIPSDVAKINTAGHRVYIEEDAGKESGFSDADYYTAGAIITTHEQIWREGSIMAKVKELQDLELPLVPRNTTIFLFAHLKGDRNQELFFDTAETRNIQAIPYESLCDKNGKSPILREMSKCAGELAVYIGCEHMRRDHGGLGLLPSDLTVQILGAGNAGITAERILRSLGTKNIYLHDRLKKPHCLDDQPATIAEFSKKANLIICCALDPLFGAPKLLTHQMGKQLRKSAFIVDIAIDEGGNCEFSKPTTPENPIFSLANGARVYGLPNLPGMVPRSSSPRLSNTALPYILAALELKKAKKKVTLASINKTALI